MPGTKKPFPAQERPPLNELVSELVEELKHPQESGQPRIYEQSLSRDAIRILVFWDKWDRIPLERRSSTIVEAYGQAEGSNEQSKITLASGLTFPEAVASGMLPYIIIPAIRKSDPVTIEQCRKAMIEEGGSILLDREKPFLRYGSEEEAVEAIRRLIQKLPSTDEVWILEQDLRLDDDLCSSEL